MVALTLIDGENERTFTEHPIETARRALLEAAEFEKSERVAESLRRAAEVLPDRAPRVVLPDRAPRVGAPAYGDRDWSPVSARGELPEEREWRERRAVWKAMPWERRESLLLHVLGDERRTVGELTTGLNGELCPGAKRCYSAVYDSDVRTLATRMFQAGQLERVKETYKNKPRYRYFRVEGGA